MKNNVCHVEIPITNEQVATEFYKSVFDWEIDFKALKNYGLLNTDVSIGFPISKKVVPSEQKIYIQVNNIDQFLTKIEKAGGKIISNKNKISDQIGYGAIFSDIFGNKLGLFSKD